MLVYVISGAIAVLGLYALLPDAAPVCGYYRTKGKFYYLKVFHFVAALFLVAFLPLIIYNLKYYILCSFFYSEALVL